MPSGPIAFVVSGVCIKAFTTLRKEAFVRQISLDGIWCGSATLVLFEKCDANSSAFSLLVKATGLSHLLRGGMMFLANLCCSLHKFHHNLVPIFSKFNFFLMLFCHVVLAHFIVLFRCLHA